MKFFAETTKKSIRIIENLIEQRNEAKLIKNWKLADEIRDKLKVKNVVLEDTPNGTNWRMV